MRYAKGVGDEVCTKVGVSGMKRGMLRYAKGVGDEVCTKVGVSGII